MKNHRDLFGIISNMLLVLVILLVIVLGLNRIGVYKLPDSIERLIGTYSADEGNDYGNDGKLYSSLKKQSEEGNYTFETQQLTYDNAALLLSKISPLDNYYHVFEYSVYSGEASISNSVSLYRRSGLYEASVFDSSDILIKRIDEHHDTVLITEYDRTEKSIEVPKGGFSVSDELGFIVSYEGFLNSAYELSEADFVLSYCDYGAVLSITFESVFKGYVQKEIYDIALDYGIVTGAKCYEADKMIFSMTTSSLRT